jgi:hypothetical protein
VSSHTAPIIGFWTEPSFCFLWRIRILSANVSSHLYSPNSTPQAMKKVMLLTSKSGKTLATAQGKSRDIYSSLVCSCKRRQAAGDNILAESANGYGYMHKSKLNSNGTFSVGKSWRLDELRSVQVTNVSSLLSCLLVQLFSSFFAE